MFPRSPAMSSTTVSQISPPLIVPTDSFPLSLLPMLLNSWYEVTSRLCNAHKNSITQQSCIIASNCYDTLPSYLIHLTARSSMLSMQLNSRNQRHDDTNLLQQAFNCARTLDIPWRGIYCVRHHLARVERSVGRNQGWGGETHQTTVSNEPSPWIS